MCGHPPRLPAWGRGSEQSEPHITEGIARAMHQVISTIHRQLPLPGLEPSRMSMKHTPASPFQRLSRVQQLTLNTWRLAAAKLERVLDPCSLREQAAVHATLGVLRDLDNPLALFRRHAEAHPEFALIAS